MTTQEHHVAEHLRIAKEQLAYCKFISNYPKNMGKKGFDTVATIDSFYKSTCNMFFNDSLLIISSFLNNDKRVMSFWNWQDFMKHKRKEIESITDIFNKKNFKQIRDQMIAHQDISNANNNFPSPRRRGIIRQEIVEQLQDILDKMIKELCDYAKKFSTPYSSQYFDSSNAEKEIKTVMKLAEPVLTNDDLI